MQKSDLTTDDVTGLVRRLWQEGVTSFCPTLVTHSHERMAQSLATIRRTCDKFAQEGLSIAGVHLEGPFISAEDGSRGAHPREYARLPDCTEYCQLQAASGGRVKIVTLAPELPGATQLIRRIASDGVIASIGHTNATRADIQAAVEAGARLSTHLGNASHQMLPRHHNYIWEQMAEDRLMASIITDTHHLPAAVVTCMIRAKGPGKVIIISDAAFPGGLAPGLYKNTYADGVLELRPDGYLSVPGTTNLAGSSSSLRQCIAGAASLTKLPLRVLLPMATETPANLLGRPDLGRITPGARADLVLFRENDGTLEVQTTLLAGETVFQR